MFKEYIYLENLTNFQKDLVHDFNNKFKEYEKIVNCEICESSKISTLFNNDRYGINNKTCFCDECGFIFSNPRMTNRFIEFFYNSDFYRFLYSGTGKEFNKETLFSTTLLELKNYKPEVPKKPNFNQYYPNLYFDFINNEIKDFESVLDIGCGKGKKLINFNNIKKKTEGIEPSKIYNKVHAEIGLNSNIGFIKDVKKKYDLVLLVHVFEHLTNLKETVDILSNITKKYLFIEVPGHVKKLQSIQNAHNYYFSLNTLNYFILNNKFKLIKADYARDNEFLMALYEKTEKRSEYKFNKKKEREYITYISKIYFLKYILIKFLRLTGLEKISRLIYNKLKNLE
jgi:SAM-dependent methyltransferase